MAAALTFALALGAGAAQAEAGYLVGEADNFATLGTDGLSYVLLAVGILALIADQLYPKLRR